MPVCMGLYNHHKSTQGSSSIVPCSDMCGVVTAVGEGTSSWKVGDRVLSTFNQAHLTGQVTAKDMTSGLGLPLPGVLATHRVFPATGLVRAPEHLSDEEAATLPIAAVTAWMSINGMRRDGETVGKDEYIVLQGTGGVATAGLQIAAAAGAKGGSLRQDCALSRSDASLPQTSSHPHRMPSSKRPKHSALRTPSTTARTPNGRTRSCG